MVALSLAYFPLYPDRYEADTAHLSLLEDGAYNRLLRLCWRTPGCKLPDDMGWIMRQVRAVSETDQAAVLAVLSEFFTKARGKTWNKKLFEIYGQVSVAHGNKVEAGKKGAAAKALKRNKKEASNASSSAVATLKQPEPEPEPEPEEIKGVPPSIPNEEKSSSSAQARLSILEEVMLAVGVDPKAPPKFWRGSAASTHVLGWQVAFGLTDDEVVEAARLSQDGHSEPPDGPKALDRFMAGYAKAKASAEAAGKPSPAAKPKAAPKPPASPEDRLAFYAEMVNSDKYIPPSMIGNTMRDALLHSGLVTKERLRDKGIYA